MKKYINFIVIGVLLLLLVSCSPATSKESSYVNDVEANYGTQVFEIEYGDVERFVDYEAGVVCYIQTGVMSSAGSIHCLLLEDTNLRK